MTNLLTWSFWFTLRPESLIPTTQKLFIGLLIAFTLAALIIALLKRKSGIYRGFFKSLYNFLLSNVVIGFILFFCNYEMVPFFSARFWLAIWFITMLIWLFFVVKKLKAIPLYRKENEKEQELKKYLP